MTIHPRTFVASLTVGLALGAGAPSAAHAQLFYGGDDFAFSNTSYVNNPSNAVNQIVFDNFSVAAGTQWTVSSLFGALASSNLNPFPATLGWEIRTGMVAGSSTGTVVHTGFGGYSVSGNVYTVAVPSFVLTAGTYWMGLWADLGGFPPVQNMFVGVDRTRGTNSVNAPSDGAAIWLVGANASNVGGNANLITSDFSYGVNGQSVVVNAVPEPSTWMLLGGGLLSLAAVARRRRA